MEVVVTVRHARENQAFRSLVEAQAGVVSRRQLVALGWTDGQILAATRDHWRLLHRGVYLVPPQPEPGDLARVWAGVLAAGSGAAASHGTALWLVQGLDACPLRVHVTVPSRRRVVAKAGIDVHLTRRSPELVPAIGSPPRTNVEESLLDVTDTAVARVDVADALIRVVQRRLTTPGRLREALTCRPRHRHRSLLEAMLAETEDGVLSPLEHEYLVRVERPHGLPRGTRNEGVRSGPANIYRDVWYREWRTVVELDGREAHRPESSFRDRQRDNRSTASNLATLRYGWHETTSSPCAVAVEVGVVLNSQGWPDAPTPCGEECVVRHHSR